MREENIEKMDFKELRKEVQLLRDELAIFKRKYEDAIYNLDSSNFGKSFAIEYGNMKTAIKITANGLESTVSKTDLATELFKYSTIEQTAKAITATVTADYVDSLTEGGYATNAVLTSKLNLNSESILAEVSGEYQTKSDAEGEYEALYDSLTELSLTIDGITSTVSKNISAYFESSTHPNRLNDLTDEQKSMLCLYNGTYYYYNDFDKAWELYPADGLKTMFRQTATGFKLTGDVSVSGDLVSGGSIYGAELVSSDGSRVLKMEDNELRKGDFQLYKAEDGAMETYPYFGVYNLGVGRFINLSTYGNIFMRVFNSGLENGGSTTKPEGVWDFENCTVEGLTTVAVFG